MPTIVMPVLADKHFKIFAANKIATLKGAELASDEACAQRVDIILKGLTK
jgi:hypothetical protein